MTRERLPEYLKTKLATVDNKDYQNVRKILTEYEELKNMKDTVIDPENTTIYISHSDCIERAQAAAERFKTEVGFKDVVITSIGTIIGAHTGPGLISTFWFGKERQ